MADIALSHPELARRWGLLVGRAWEHGWDIWISSSSRSYETQSVWWDLYQSGLWPARVAPPDQIWGPSPWGWDARGSLHMVQEDGYSHALDLGWRGPFDFQLFEVAARCGLRFPEQGEAWHAQWWGLDGIYPVEEIEDDMTVDEFFEQTGRVGNDLGQVSKRDGVWGQVLSDGVWYTIQDRQEFIHRKLYPIATPDRVIEEGADPIAPGV